MEKDPLNDLYEAVAIINSALTIDLRDLLSQGTDKLRETVIYLKENLPTSDQLEGILLLLDGKVENKECQKGPDVGDRLKRVPFPVPEQTPVSALGAYSLLAKRLNESGIAVISRMETLTVDDLAKEIKTLGTPRGKTQLKDIKRCLAMHGISLQEDSDGSKMIEEYDSIKEKISSSFPLLPNEILSLDLDMLALGTSLENYLIRSFPSHDRQVPLKLKDLLALDYRKFSEAKGTGVALLSVLNDRLACLGLAYTS